MILWPESDTPSIEEERFLRKFCRKTAREQTAEPLVTFKPSDLLGKITAGFSAESGDCLIVNDGKIVIPQAALPSMRRTMRRKKASVVGPVMNASASPSQTFVPPFRYYDLATLREAAEATAERYEDENFTAFDLDPSCFLVSAGFLDRLPRDLPVGEIPSHLLRDAVISKGAYIHRFSGYYSNGREDLERLVPADCRKILDLGCAEGGFGRTLKRRRPDVILTGVELYPELAGRAAGVYDEILIGSLEEISLPSDFDGLVMGDILEHLVDPWRSLRRLHSHLKSGGCLVGSVPNVGHWSIARNLLKGDFAYVPFGLLCIGHLRFFTEITLREALEETGFEVDFLGREQPSPSPQGALFLEEMMKSPWSDRDSLLTSEFIFRAKKA